jgi:hypothetical protein
MWLAIPAAGALAAACLVGGPAVTQAAPRAAAAPAGGSSLPVKAIEKIEQADGTFSSGVLTIDIERDNVTPKLHGRTLRDGFEVQHELYFQSLGKHRATINGELALKTGQTQRVIDRIESEHLAFQAMHQHFIDAHPRVWFIHFRGTGHPKSLARRVHRVVEATGVKLPQSSPKHPKTHLPVKRLAKILGGTAEKAGHGIVDIEVDRKNTEKLGGHAIKPDLGVATSIGFLPWHHGRKALVVPDFGMTAKEIAPVTKVMRSHGWTDECLYNQETDEHPQLYFSHMVKKGKPVALAHQIRKGLNQMNVEHSAS